jgi:membrane associated rhomboid family serine protease
MEAGPGARVFPFIDTAPRAARPAIVLSIIAANAIVFLWMWSLPPRALNAVLIHLALVPVRYTEPTLALRVGLDPANWWPFLINAFMHGGWLHLIINMWFLWIFGPAMEARFGRLWFSLMYVGGALAASAVHVFTHPDSTVPVLGASGAVAAVIAAYAVTYPSARVITIIPIFFIPLFIPISARWFALIWFALQVIQGTAEIATPGLAGGVAWWAHIGGFAFGALFASLANLFGLAMQTRTTIWEETRGRRVPSIPPPKW